MFGRRSYARFALSPSSDGVLCVLRDVVVQRVDASEIVAISREAGVLDERMLIEIPGTDGSLTVTVQVIESRPIVVDGTVRHRLRLARLEAADPNYSGVPVLQS